MFFQLPQIQKMNQNVDILQKNQQNLRTLLNRAKTTSSKVQISLDKTIQLIRKNCAKDLEELSNFENDIQNGYMVPEQIEIDGIIYDKSQLPDWFQFVLQKQFSKHKKDFDLMAKKHYKIHGLRQKKIQTEQQMHAFNNLYQRYKALNTQDKDSLNIMSEAQSIKNKTNFLKNKVSNFCQLITSKLVSFVQENAQKSLSYHSKINSFTQQTANQTIYHQGFNAYNLTKEQTVQRSFMKNSLPATSTHISGRLITSTSLNKHPSIRSINQSAYERPIQTGYGFYGGINHRNYAPRWLNGTANDFYN